MSHSFKLLFFVIQSLLILAVTAEVQAASTIYVKKEYWPNGKLKTEMPIVNSKAEGITKRYYESGKILSIVPFHNGLAEGMTKLFRRNGALLIETKFRAGRKNGVMKAFYPNGNLLSYTLYENDLPKVSRLHRTDGTIFERHHDVSSALSAEQIKKLVSAPPLKGP